MHTFKLGFIALALVSMLGLVAPGAFGGTVSADVSDNNPHSGDPRTLVCHGVPYTVTTTDNAASFQDVNSSTVFVVVTVDVHRDYYTTGATPTYLFSRDLTFGAGSPHGKKTGASAHSTSCLEGPNDFPLFTDDGVDYHVISNRVWHVIVTGSGARTAHQGGHHRHERRRHR